MDNLRTTWGPRGALLWIGAAATAGVIVGAAVLGMSGDGPGAMLVGSVAVILTAITLHGALVRPRLTAGEEGIHIRFTARTREVPWNRLQARLASTRRFGRETTTLELDITDDDPQLVVFGWIELGADPADVLADLDRIRHRGN